MADQLADLPPQVHICSGQEWQFNISIVSYRQINWQIYPPELTSSGQGWQLPDLLPDLTTNALWDIYYGMYLVAILDSSRKGENFLLLVNN